MKNKIALFLPSLHGGGAERVMINLAKGFERVIKMWEELYHEILCRKGWLFD